MDARFERFANAFFLEELQANPINFHYSVDDPQTWQVDESQLKKMSMILQLFGVHQLCALLYDFVRGGVGHKKAGRRFFLLKSDQSVEVSGNLV